MEVHKYMCDCCGKELDKRKWTITQHYQDSHWDGLDEEWENYTVDHLYHLCPECWGKIAALVIKK